MVDDFRTEDFLVHVSPEERCHLIVRSRHEAGYIGDAYTGNLESPVGFTFGPDFEFYDQHVNSEGLEPSADDLRGRCSAN